ncbi:conserved hypothetical protein [Ricinus communis]|uniref:Ty3 transposon capsid-like protein domain-containing protein n=1 Tax=Ricinus communis TaxID=3988 RepID=B9SIM6_RICCO|nr:conserved hypothetical protein [Ricinus communis]
MEQQMDMMKTFTFHSQNSPQLQNPLPTKLHPTPIHLKGLSKHPTSSTSPPIHVATSSGTRLLPTPKMNNIEINGFSANAQGLGLQMPKVELSTFEGTTTLYLGEKVDIWYQRWRVQTKEKKWEVFAKELCRRFGKVIVSDIVEESNRIQQVGSVINYQERFEELRSLMLKYNPMPDESYFMSSFVSGLNEEIRSMVKLLKLATLSQAYERAKLYEKSIEAMFKRHKFLPKTNYQQPCKSNFTKNSTPTPSFLYRPTPRPKPQNRLNFKYQTHSSH